MLVIHRRHDAIFDFHQIHLRDYLQSLARQLGFEALSSDPQPAKALAAAQSWARERGAAVLVTGSVYLVGELLGELRDGGAGEESEARSRRTAI